MPFTDSIKLVDVVMAEKSAITAVPSDVANGKVFVGTTLNLETGTLPVASEHGDITLLAGESHEVPYGKIPATYTVYSTDLASQTAGTAIASDLIVNKTSWVNGVKITGTMPNIGSESETLLAGNSHTISKGYHDGTGVITAKDLASQTTGTAVEADILLGKLAWVNGVQIGGTMGNIGAQTGYLNCGETFNISEGYHNGSGLITANSLASQTVSDAETTDILSGKTAWVNGVKITGEITKWAASTEILALNGTYVIPKGYHTGLGQVTQNIPTQEGQTFGPTKDAQTILTAGHYMTGNITITGVDALNYQRLGTAVKDSEGNTVSNYEIPVSSNVGTIVLYVDNWHDNNSFSLYKINFTDLIDASGNAVNLNCQIAFDYADTDSHTYNFNGITIVASLESGTNAHKFEISNITSGKVTIIDAFGARIFGV